MIIPWSALVQSNSFMIADEFSIGIAFLCGERFGRKESREKKETDQTFGKREKCTNVSSVRCCIVSVRKGMENDKDTKQGERKR